MNYLWPEDGTEIDANPAVIAHRLAPIPSFLNMASNGLRLFIENIIPISLLSVAHLGAMMLLLALMGIIMAIFSSPWPAVVLGGLVILFFVGPVFRLLSAHLSLNIYDDSSSSPFDAIDFVRSSYKQALYSYLVAVYYELDLLARSLPSFWPGLLLAVITHSVLHFATNIENKYFWDILVLTAITIPLALFRLWGRIRRNHFLYSMTAFEIVDSTMIFAVDLPGDEFDHWRGRLARLFYRLNDSWWQSALNLAAFVWLIKNILWLLPAFLIISSSIMPMAKFYIFIVFILTLRYIFNIWYNIASANWFREILASGKYY